MDHYRCTHLSIYMFDKVECWWFIYEPPKKTLSTWRVRNNYWALYVPLIHPTKNNPKMHVVYMLLFLIDSTVNSTSETLI